MASAERVWVRDYGGDRCHVTLSDACPTSSVRHAKFPSETVYFLSMLEVGRAGFRSNRRHSGHERTGGRSRNKVKQTHKF